MALTKVTKTGISDNSIDADKIEDGTVVAADIADGTITNAKLAGSIANDKLANSSITVNGSSISLGGSVSAGKVQWQTVKTADFNAVAGEGYFVDTDSVGAVTATLPGSPSAGDTIAFKDYAANFGTNSLTIARNGNNIQGVANNSEITTNRASIVLVYIDATKGWLYTNESNVADLQLTQFTEATGGTITTSGDFKIHTFTGDGCFAVSQIGIQAGGSGGPSNVDYLVIAGGGTGGWGIGGAGANSGGGGGAGGYRTTFPSPGCNAGAFPITATTYPITVGAGGSGVSVPNGWVGLSGSNSVFSTITSAGGGGGGGPYQGPVPANTAQAGSGGSGGGGGGQGGPTSFGAGNTPPVSPPQGNNGGSTGPTGGPGRSGAGGGGAGGTGPNGCTVGGNGGNGLANSITGSSVTRAGGGGGAGNTFNPGAAGTGGPGGGGVGGFRCGPPGAPHLQQIATRGGTPATANTGSGGGGGAFMRCNDGGGGNGGSGIVVVRYKYQ